MKLNKRAISTIRKIMLNNAKAVYKQRIQLAEDPSDLPPSNFAERNVAEHLEYNLGDGLSRWESSFVGFHEQFLGWKNNFVGIRYYPDKPGRSKWTYTDSKGNEGKISFTKAVSMAKSWVNNPFGLRVLELDMKFEESDLAQDIYALLDPSNSHLTVEFFRKYLGHDIYRAGKLFFVSKDNELVTQTAFPSRAKALSFIVNKKNTPNFSELAPPNQYAKLNKIFKEIQSPLYRDETLKMELNSYFKDEGLVFSRKVSISNIKREGRVIYFDLYVPIHSVGFAVHKMFMHSLGDHGVKLDDTDNGPF